MILTVWELKDYINSLPDDYKGIGVDSVDSWRGSYYEPAFTFGETTKSEMLNVISQCLEDDFEGYKGGTFRYDVYSPVNFDTYGSCTDDGYFYKNLSENLDSQFFTGLIKILAGCRP